MLEITYIMKYNTLVFNRKVMRENSLQGEIK